MPRQLQNKQSWAIRVVDNPDFINGITEVYKKQNPKAAEDPNFKNMFRNAPTIVFIANDKSYDVSTDADCRFYWVRRDSLSLVLWV